MNKCICCTQSLVSNAHEGLLYTLLRVSTEFDCLELVQQDFIVGKLGVQSEDLDNTIRDCSYEI